MLTIKQTTAVQTIRALQGAISEGRGGVDTLARLKSNLAAFWASLESGDRRAIWEAGREQETLFHASQAVGQLPKGAG